MKTYNRSTPKLSGSAKATVALQTVGCKLNQAESESLMRQFRDAGYRIVSENEKADVFILKTCTVTHIADRKCRQYLRNFRRENPDSLVVALGCYADRNADALLQAGVDLAIGNAETDRVVEIIESKLDHHRGSCNESPSRSEAIFRTRPMIKIQEGCSFCCSYCIVPHVRGPEQSMAAEKVIAEIKSRVAEGCHEIILTGTRIGAYDGPGGLQNLVQRILNETSVAQIRLSSLQPGEISPSLIQLWKDEPRVCRHLHLALQSGSDTVLRRMNRAYSLKGYQETVNAARQAMPDIAITTDVIVGFPGESAVEFDESYRFCEEIRFAKLHIFAYSVRQGTPASKMANKIPDSIKKDRSRAMLDLARRSEKQYRSKFFGKTMPVLWEERKGDHFWVGHTDNYLKVITRSENPLANRRILTKIGAEYENSLWGDIKLDSFDPKASQETAEKEAKDFPLRGLGDVIQIQSIPSTSEAKGLSFTLLRERRIDQHG